MDDLPATSAPAQRDSPPVWYENFPVVSAVILVVSLVFLGLHWWTKTPATSKEEDSLLNFVLKEVGFAGLVAFILNLSIEWVNRKRHAGHQESLLARLEIKHEQTSAKLLKDVNEHLFKTIYERNIDPSVFQQVEEHLLRAKVMRKEFIASFKITRFSKPGDKLAERYVRIDFCNSYRIFNLTDKPIEVDVAKAIVDVTPNFKEDCYFKRVTLGAEELNRGALKEADCIKEMPNRNFITLHVKRTIPPADSLPVTVEYTKLAPLDYSEIVLTTVPMDGLMLEISDPEETFTTEALSLHPESENLLTPPDQKHLRKWKIDQAILPGQGIVMLWHPTEAHLPQKGADLPTNA